MALITRHETPGALRDAGELSSPFYARWHEEVNSAHRAGVVNRATTDTTAVASRTITWLGLSRQRLVLTTGLRDNRPRVFIGGDDREQQFEYLEWHTQRDRRGRVTRVTFCTEVPEYWQALAAHDPERVLALYRTLVSPSVRLTDLFTGSGAASSYDPRNRWNTRDGIVHLTNAINTLHGAFSVTGTGASSTGTATHNYATRHSPGLPHAADPRIFLEAAGVARLGVLVALDEPIGLYILGWDDSGWTKPDGSPVGDYFRILRGTPGAALRVVVEVPASEGFTLADVRIGGRPVEFGAQLAEHITVGVRALGVRYGR